MWLAVGVFAGVVLLPNVPRLLRLSQTPVQGRQAGNNGAGSGLDRRDLWRDRRLYLVLPSILVLPFVLTGLFLYQAVLAEIHISARS